jgi:hypothetical protein
MEGHSVPANAADGLAEFETHIRNNYEVIPNFGERYRQGETTSGAFVESTINQVVSRRFVKKQQMQCYWVPISRYRRGPRSSTTNWRTCSGAGTRGSANKRPEPQLLDALLSSSEYVLLWSSCSLKVCS